MTLIELRRKLLGSPSLRNCGSPRQVSAILSSDTQWADADCVYIFAQEYDKNICVHYYEEDTLTFLHYKVNHRHTDQLAQNISLERNSNEPAPSETITPGIMTRYLIAKARPSHILLPWSSNNSDNTTFTHMQQLDEQPFAYKENLVYVLTSDIFLETEVLEALLERKYISKDELRSSERSVGEIHTMEMAKGRMLGIFIKPHVDSKPLRPD